MTTAERFISKIAIGDDCWEWLGRRGHHGYGYFDETRDGKGYGVRAHRKAYEMFVGPVPDGLTLDHLCKNEWCVRPNHLEPVTQKVNTLRGDGPTARNAAKTQCPRGHKYTPENTGYSHGRGKPPFRYCRRCDLDRKKKPVGEVGQ